jgi:hypothetical protein
MQVILQGEDQRKAKTWLQFAKTKLRQLKAFRPPNGIINRSYKPVSGVGVYIKSVNGIDTIRITTEGGKYMCDFPTVDRYSIPHSDFQVRCPARPKAADEFLRLGFLSRSNNINSRAMGGDWDTYFWDFGDGEFGSGASVFHQYAEAGEYTVSLTVSKDVVSTNLYGTNTGGMRQFGSDSTVLEPYVKAQSTLAWADYLADTPQGPFGNAFAWEISATNRNAAVGMDIREQIGYSFLSQGASRSFNLSSVTPGSTVTAYMTLWLLNQICNTPNHLDPCYDDASGAILVTSDAGGSFTPTSNYGVVANMGDISASVGGTAQVNVVGAWAEVEIPYPGTPAWPNREAWGNTLGVGGSDIWAVAEEAGTLMKTTKTIKVYTGRKGHKKSFQAGDSVHT